MVVGGGDGGGGTSAGDRPVPARNFGGSSGVYAGRKSVGALQISSIMDISSINYKMFTLIMMKIKSNISIIFRYNAAYALRFDRFSLGFGV